MILGRHFDRLGLHHRWDIAVVQNLVSVCFVFHVKIYARLIRLHYLFDVTHIANLMLVPCRILGIAAWSDNARVGPPGQQFSPWYLSLSSEDPTVNMKAFFHS